MIQHESFHTRKFGIQFEYKYNLMIIGYRCEINIFPFQSHKTDECIHLHIDFY